MAHAFDMLENKYGFVDPPVLSVVEDQGCDTAKAKNIKEDYPLLEDQQTEDKPLADWKQSKSVCMLSAFLKEFNAQGIFLKQTVSGMPALVFNPGLPLKEKDPDRFACASHAMDLYYAAFDDLHELIYNGLLNLQIHSVGLDE